MGEVKVIRLLENHILKKMIKYYCLIIFKPLPYFRHLEYAREHLTIFNRDIMTKSFQPCFYRLPTDVERPGCR